MGTLAISTLASGASFSVTNTADSGAASLRQAIIDANASAGSDTIFMSDVASNATITLASPLPMITESVVIDGAGANGLTVSGAGSHRVFIAQAGAVTISAI